MDIMRLSGEILLTAVIVVSVIGTSLVPGAPFLLSASNIKDDRKRFAYTVIGIALNASAFLAYLVLLEQYLPFANW